jgi:uncharacterized repeat protein (TIGR02543 family)
VSYGKEYSYDPDTQQYSGLPRPVRTGYDFQGWYDVPDPGGDAEAITDTTTVKTAGDHTLYAIWTQSQYTVTVHFRYLDEDGKEFDLDNAENLAKLRELLGLGETEEPVTEVTQTYAPAETYSITLPDYGGFKRDPEADVISGTVTLYHVEYTVTYREVLSVDITWGDMTFDMESVEWNTDTHLYKADTYQVEKEDGDLIKVKNNGSSKLLVNYLYQSEPDYSSITVTFKDTEGNPISEAGQEISGQGEGDARVSLSGIIYLQTLADFKPGTCTVVISKAEG